MSPTVTLVVAVTKVNEVILETKIGAGKKIETATGSGTGTGTKVDDVHVLEDGTSRKGQAGRGSDDKGRSDTADNNNNDGTNTSNSSNSSSNSNNYEMNKNNNSNTSSSSSSARSSVNIQAKAPRTVGGIWGGLHGGGLGSNMQNFVLVGTFVRTDKYDMMGL